jgi:S-formylglutathione hydrolase FrmB
MMASGCGDNSGGGSTELVCAGSASGTLSQATPVAVEGADAADLRGAAVSAQSPAVTAPPAPVTIECAGSDIVPDGFIALGPAVSFGPAGAASDRSFRFTLPYKKARLPEGATRRHVRVLARRHLGQSDPIFLPIANLLIEDDDPFRSRIHFNAHELVTYQVVAPADAGQTEMRRYTYRAIAGISMGGNAAMSIALRNHDRFDTIVDMVGEPGPSMKYTLTMIREYLFGGFCTAAHQAAGLGDIGELCLDQQRPVFADQHEVSSNFEAMLFQDGDGVGLTLDRELYMRASRDLSRAFGNPAHYNPDNPYLPPGVPEAFLEQDPATRCANPVVLEDFFDHEFNPDGSNPVITFCDGGDSRDGLGLGVFDPALPQNDPAEVLLAVDLDDNGVRDPGEPVITNAFEPFADIGSDGVADGDETGPLGAYDPVTNPDPAGDNYHALRNPTGTEKNFDRDEGEPFSDFGIDGIEGTCQAGETPQGPIAGCYDFGEGDGEWSISPNLARWYESDIGVLLGRMSDTERRRMNIWLDAGIRDFLNASVSANAGMGIITGTHRLQGAIFDQFGPLHNADNEATFNFQRIEYDGLPQNIYVRIGDPDAGEQKIMSGDGRHVGTALQLVNRLSASFFWLQAQWPNGDRDDETGAGSIDDELFFTAPSTGRESPFALFLPPGYDKPENADKTYPVVFFLHGYGQEPNDLVIASGIFENFMVNRSVEPEERFAKFIMVYVDGRCRPGGDVPLEQTGDMCEQGTFYVDAPLGGPAQMETNMLELMDHIDANYRTKPAEMVEVLK